MAKKAIIIGAGPAGLTAAYELLKRTDIIPIILEKSGEIGGISRTINYKGNRMDMGPHRFFSKSDRVMDWWLKMMPLEEGVGEEVRISYQNKSREVRPEDSVDADGASTQKDPEKVMLVIQRLTRIYFLRKFFAYPIQLGFDTLRTLGVIRTFKILISFLWVRLFPIKPENSLEDFIINKFGKQLYLLFFKDYTEKVWGVPCHEISAEWGAQRIKGVSLSKAVLEALKTMRKKKGGADLGQKGIETSLIEQFLYPKHGPGSLWEEVARQVQEMGGKIFFYQDVSKIYFEEGTITIVNTVNSQTGQTGAWEGDYFFSTMPVKELIAGMGDTVPENVSEVAEGLQYRDFINVGILLRQLSGPGKKPGEYEKLDLKDNWIYIQERDVNVGRLMIYNNWGGGMIKDPNTTWIGMEYFCNKTDAVWALDDEAIQAMAILELEKIGLARVEDVLDATVRRMEKTYPAYFGTYDRFAEIREFTDQFENLFLVGRNGMHKYNNADHSMLCAMVAVDNIEAGVLSKNNLWSINTEQEYHEEKVASESAAPEGQHINKEVPATSIPSRVLAISFSDFLWKNRWNKGYILFAFAAFIVQFILFKVRYPYANYMPDSYSYIEAAARNLDVNMWPVAYSKFLRLVSVFSHTDTAVVGLQYFLFQASELTFLYTLIYFLSPGKIVRNVLYAFFVFNPLPLYVANYISADALFIGLSLLWLTTLIWVIYRPSAWQIWVHGVLLLACFTVRYNAIYYPMISILAFILSKQRWYLKVAGIGLGLALVAGSFFYTTNKMFLETGKRQFSAFGGWQLANDALYMYEHIPASQRGPIPTKFAKLEVMVREHMDTLNKVKLTASDTANTFFYLWNEKGPLIKYMERDWKKDSTTPYFKRWAAEGPLYSSYALSLILKYPLEFAKQFLLSNTGKYAAPPAEFLGNYNMGGDSVGALAKDWFKYKSRKISNKGSKKINFISNYSIFSAMINVLMIMSIVGTFMFSLITSKTFKAKSLFYLCASFWLLNIFFSVSASPIVLRYQLVPIILIFSTSLIVFEPIYKSKNQVGVPAN